MDNYKQLSDGLIKLCITIKKNVVHGAEFSMRSFCILVGIFWGPKNVAIVQNREVAQVVFTLTPACIMNFNNKDSHALL